ncbi:NADH dehydrogenase [ubiquinone] 1 alpha subcomplex subunit 2 [Tetrabaena socialis]|uniref:NADH dehydrogenase [ubiquinone] 1 alpha subcomplex subunit 2 n=1 Tax=Tetrabaena socialis TaxID=47790 RepID=A0A2J8A6D5_9CHLO|nr:NADH dehydrogenase [ubiquinone] 1 alpha subcomplex subunit 2 [Tetrabaena socialis]|eukprot:PNH08091.1 NADH dehydrogenase [ubiquinone] 1 alpha subcomplex subunit 2 [Tetrabaena socialis]
MAWRGALSKSMQELRIHLCQTSTASQGVREFVVANYAEMKRANPHFPILIRECAGAEAKLTARYGEAAAAAPGPQLAAAPAAAGLFRRAIARPSSELRSASEAPSAPMKSAKEAFATARVSGLAAALATHSAIAREARMEDAGGGRGRRYAKVGRPEGELVQQQC